MDETPLDEHKNINADDTARDEILFSREEFKKVKEALHIYGWAQKILLSKLQILSEALDSLTEDSLTEANPIEHMKWRVKNPIRIARKLHRLGHDVTAQSMRENLTDIVGFRIICAFSQDIKTIVDMLKTMPDTKIIREKDYITNPKPSGYRSYHLIIEIPVYYLGTTEIVPVEIQLRTSAMDFWATLEHKVQYTHQGLMPRELREALAACADQIADLDNRMFVIHDIVNLIEKKELYF